jgi:hypothetical protein
VKSGGSEDADLVNRFASAAGEEMEVEFVAGI